MLDKEAISRALALIDGRDYGAYQSLLGVYQFPLFKLIIEQIPKDPYAPPHAGVYRIIVKRSDARIINLKLTSKIQRIAFADFLTRQFYYCSERIAKGFSGTGYSGVITISPPGQAILERNCVVVGEDFIEVRCFVGLPGKGRRVVADIAERMLLTALPKIVEQSLLRENVDQKALQKHIAVAEDANYLRQKLDERGLIAFVANGAVLPRESGMSDKPMQDSRGVIRFFAPESLSQEITLPNAGQMKGLAIPKGINLIVGGGYHGKSTLLQALETGIYNHVPGDGREYCVSNLKTVKIRAYNGRPVVKTDVSMFINDLPFQQDTTSFCTNNASGSTSQAAYIVEAMEIGAEVLLMDEDTCAANFMIRDHKMQQLVDKKEEPITAFIDKVKRLHTEKNISTVLVLGGVGDYFSVADHVIQMKAYQPFDVTSKARQIVFDSLQARAIEDNANQICFRKRIPIADSIVPFNRYHKFSVSAKETHRLLFGGSLVDLTDVEQLIELSQTKALAYAMAYAKKFMDGKTILRDVVDKVIRDIENNGLDILSERISGQFAVFRSMELAFALNRLANLKIKQKDE